VGIACDLLARCADAGCFARDLCNPVPYAALAYYLPVLWTQTARAFGASLPQPDPNLSTGNLVGAIANSLLHGLVALTGLEAVSNGLLFIKDEDAGYVSWGKRHLPRLASLWNFLSGRVGAARTIQFGFLFWGGITTALNSHFSNYFNVLDGTDGRTLVGNLAFIGLVPLGGVVLFLFRQFWASLTLSFANMTAYEDMQSTAYRDGVQGLLPMFLVYRSPNGNFPRPTLATFIIATVIMILVSARPAPPSFTESLRPDCIHGFGAPTHPTDLATGLPRAAR
jgi:hypothetical protein